MLRKERLARPSCKMMRNRSCPTCHLSLSLRKMILRHRRRRRPTKKRERNKCRKNLTRRRRRLTKKRQRNKCGKNLRCRRRPPTKKRQKNKCRVNLSLRRFPYLQRHHLPGHHPRRPRRNIPRSPFRSRPHLRHLRLLAFLGCPQSEILVQHPLALPLRILLQHQYRCRYPHLRLLPHRLHPSV